MVDRIGRGTEERKRKRSKMERGWTDLNSQRAGGKKKKRKVETKEENEEKEEKREAERRRSDEFSTHTPKPSALISSQFRWLQTSTAFDVAWNTAEPG